MDNFKDFLYNNRGSIIGILIAIVILFTRLYHLVIGIILIAIGAYVGRYIQDNKIDVKDKIKKFIDRL